MSVTLINFTRKYIIVWLQHAFTYINYLTLYHAFARLTNKYSENTSLNTLRLNQYTDMTTIRIDTISTIEEKMF